MDEPVITQRSPYVIEEQPGKKWWCACGRSAKQPYCDGSHKGTSFAPVLVEITEPKRIAYCGCKHSKAMPLCDGSHRDLPA